MIRTATFFQVFMALLCCGAAGHAQNANGPNANGPNAAPSNWHATTAPSTSNYLLDELTFFAGIDGSKQPQDFGANAHLGGQVSMNWGIPIWSEYGIGAQIGTGITATDNAVRVYELLGEVGGRTQSYTTVGLFQHLNNGFSWGFAYDFLTERYYDNFSLGQWRVRGSYDLTSHTEVGVTAMLEGHSDTGVFGRATTPTTVKLSAISQGSLYCRHFWSTGVQTTAWIGIADGHGEDNAIVGPAPRHDTPVVFGGDVLAPLSRNLAIYGETNLMMPADTGTVDAFLGIQWYPGGKAYRARRGRFSPLLPLASTASFSVDLSQ